MADTPPDAEAMIRDLDTFTRIAELRREREGRTSATIAAEAKVNIAQEALRTALAAGAKAVDDRDQAIDALKLVLEVGLADEPGSATVESVVNAVIDSAAGRTTLIDWAKLARDWLISEARVRELEADLVVAAERKRNNDADMLAEIRALKADNERKDAALQGLLNCPAIADGDLRSPEWGCPESAEAEKVARAAIAKKEPAHE